MHVLVLKEIELPMTHISDASKFYWFLLNVLQKPQDDKYPVGPGLLALFIFVVCGSGKAVVCFVLTYV
jgi:hypothetical protein